MILMTLTKQLMFYILMAATAISTANSNSNSNSNSTDFKVALNLNASGLATVRESLLRVSDYTHSEYGKYLSKQQIIELVKPDQSARDLVISTFRKSNITCIDQNIYLSCIGLNSDVRRFFKQTSTVDNYHIPHQLLSYVPFVEGLVNKHYPQPVTKTNVNTSGSVDPGYVGREVVMKLYNISKDLDCTNQSFGAAEYQGGNGFTNKDLTAGQKLNGLPQKNISSNHVIGHNSDADTETTLDLQMGTLIAKNDTVWYIENDNWLWSWATAFLQLGSVPDIVSHSWGWAIDQQCTIMQCTNETSAQYVKHVNDLYMLIAARGVTMTVSSGDSGAPGRSDEDCQGGSSNRTVIAAFPGASPYVLSVGATFVVDSNSSQPNANSSTPLCQQGKCANGTEEANVNFANVSWTAGGGFAEFFTEERPVWQDDAVQGYFNQKLPMPAYWNSKGRGGPDVAAIGHNCPVMQDGYLSPVDGTSCSSPMFASILGYINQHQQNNGKPKVGFVAPLLYAMWSQDPSTFNDITKGNNWCTESLCCDTRSDGGSDYGYLAAKGWDPVTGLGTPNVGKILAWLDTHTR